MFPTAISPADIGLESIIEYVQTCCNLRVSGCVAINNQKSHRLAASCKFYQPAASCHQVGTSLLNTSSCSKSVKIRQVVETTCIKLVDKKS